MISRRTALTGILVGAMAASPAFAHPFHLCSGEMEFNTKTGRWEVAIKLHPSDLETAIRKKAKKKVDVTIKEGSPELLEYLTKHFALSIAEPAEKKEQGKIEFVGAEMERGWLWLYFELPAPEGKGAVSLTHTILLDEVDKQSNTILVRNSGKRASLHFSKEKRKVEHELLSTRIS